MILFASGECQPMVLGSATAINQHEDRVALSLQTRVEELCESRWPSWAFRPNEHYGFRGRQAILNHADALVSACP